MDNELSYLLPHYVTIWGPQSHFIWTSAKSHCFWMTVLSRAVCGKLWFAEQMCCGHRVHTNTPLARCELTLLLTLIGRNTPLALGYQHGERETERERERERERESCESMAHLRNSVSTENEISSAIPRRCSAGVCGVWACWLPALMYLCVFSARGFWLFWLTRRAGLGSPSSSHSTA